MARIDSPVFPMRKLFQTEWQGIAFKSFARLSSENLATALALLGLRHRGQFWGWVRTADEYDRLMRAAGYGDIGDGCIDPINSASYWIAGRQVPASSKTLSR